jgi:hypothetical protein
MILMSNEKKVAHVQDNHCNYLFSVCSCHDGMMTNCTSWLGAHLQKGAL